MYIVNRFGSNGQLLVDFLLKILGKGDLLTEITTPTQLSDGTNQC